MVGDINHRAYSCYRGFWSFIGLALSSGMCWMRSFRTAVVPSVCYEYDLNALHSVHPVRRSKFTGYWEMPISAFILPPAFTALRSWAEYRGPVRRALHGLKYRQNLALGDSLSIHLIHLYNQHQLERGHDHTCSTQSNTKTNERLQSSCIYWHGHYQWQQESLTERAVF
jgi:predicted amidophosphoribosyltransferase